MFNKRGISAIVATVMIILITVAAIGILWAAIIPMIQTSLDFSSLQGRVNVLEKGYTAYDSSKEIASVQVKRDVDDGVMDRIKITFEVNGNSHSSSVIAPPSGGTRVYTFDMADIGEPDSVSVAPIFAVGNKEKEGEITSTVDIPKSRISEAVATYETGRDYTYGESCKAILDSKDSEGDGIYWIDVDGSDGDKEPFAVYCDMTTDNGGWTLVWGNVKERVNKPTTGISWNDAINTYPIISGEFGNDIEKFDLYLGLFFWNELGSELRYDWANDFGSEIDQRFYVDFNLNVDDLYKLEMSNYEQKIGSVTAGLWSTHNNRPFTTFDSDHDTNDGNCGTYYSKTPWWYVSCWSGNINGGGENNGNGYYNGAYWTGAAQQWGTNAGVGAGNGWIYIR
jgi:flagellin-like protein